MPDGSSVPVNAPDFDYLSIETPQIAASAGANASPPRPTMADVLGKQELLRRDHAVTAATRRVDNPKLLASDTEWIEHQYVAGGDWSFINFRINKARPDETPRARYNTVIATGRTLAKPTLQKVMVSSLVSLTATKPSSISKVVTRSD